MTYRVVITAAAKQDLRAAYLWAAEHAPVTAARWLHRFEAELQTLSHFPERLQLAPENALVEPEVRQLIFGKRRSAYRARSSRLPQAKSKSYIFVARSETGRPRMI